MQKAAQALIGAAVLRGLSEGCIKLDLDRLRREAMVKPTRGLDPTEAIADLLDQTLRPAPPVPAEPGTAMSGAAVAPRDGYGQDAAGALDLLPVESDRPAPAPARRPAANRPVMGRPHWTPAGGQTAPGDQESEP